MKAIAIKTWNKKGSVESYKESFGMATIGSEDHTYFKIDRFEGYGDAYKEREEPNYEIMIEGNLLFSGTKEELKNKLFMTEEQLKLKYFFEENDFHVHLFIQDNVQCAEIEKWTDGGVDMIMSLMPFSIEEFEEYLNAFDIDEQIDLHRTMKDYKEAFSISESLKDFTDFVKMLKETLKKYKKNENT